MKFLCQRPLNNLTILDWYYLDLKYCLSPCLGIIKGKLL